MVLQVNSDTYEARLVQTAIGCKCVESSVLPDIDQIEESYPQNSIDVWYLNIPFVSMEVHRLRTQEWP